MQSGKKLIIELGDSCNNNCIFCSVKNKANVNLSTSEIKKRIQDAKMKGYKRIEFSGGEPTIRKDFLEYNAELNCGRNNSQETRAA